ncbi:hypothetical protein MRX96_002188 [Rhipicephalus microplus]
MSYPQQNPYYPPPQPGFQMPPQGGYYPPPQQQAPYYPPPQPQATTVVVHEKRRMTIAGRTAASARCAWLCAVGVAVTDSWDHVNIRPAWLYLERTGRTLVKALQKGRLYSND